MTTVHAHATCHVARPPLLRSRLSRLRVARVAVGLGSRVGVPCWCTQTEPGLFVQTQLQHSTEDCPHGFYFLARRSSVFFLNRYRMLIASDAQHPGTSDRRFIPEPVMCCWLPRALYIYSATFPLTCSSSTQKTLRLCGPSALRTTSPWAVFA